MSIQSKTRSTLAFVALLAVNPALAVNCPGDSLQDAIDALYPAGVGVINVTGTCAEAISITGFRDLTINGDGSTIIQPASSLEDGIQVADGSSVKLCGITVDGGKTGIVVSGGQVVNVGTCGAGGLTVKNANQGIVVLEQGVFQSRNGVPLMVKDNAEEGIFVTSGSRLNIQGMSTTASVEFNGGNGIQVGEGATAFLFHTTVRNNAGSGVLGFMGSVVHLGFSDVTDNGRWGVLLTNNVTGQIAGGTSSTSTITGNGSGGVLVTQRSALRLQNSPVVSGNTGSNLECSVGGDAYGDASGIPNAKKDCKSFESVAVPINP